MQYRVEHVSVDALERRLTRYSIEGWQPHTITPYGPTGCLVVWEKPDARRPDTDLRESPDAWPKRKGILGL